MDYELEPWTGRLLFKAPIPSFDADLNPNSIRVSYEVDSGGEAFAVYGADAQVQATEKLRVGGVYVRDEDPGKSFGMRAVTGEYKFGERTTLSAELASTRNGDSSLLDSQLTGQPGGQGATPTAAPGADLLAEHSGSARRVEFRHEGTDLNVRRSTPAPTKALTISPRRSRKAAPRSPARPNTASTIPRCAARSAAARTTLRQQARRRHRVGGTPPERPWPRPACGAMRKRSPTALPGRIRRGALLGHHPARQAERAVADQRTPSATWNTNRT